MDPIATATATMAAGLLASTSGRLLWSGLRNARRAWSRHELTAAHQEELRRATQTARLAGQAGSYMPDSTAASWRVMEVVEVEDESSDCRSFYLQDALPGVSPPDFLPGQFALVRPALGGSHLPARCYSLSDAPGQPWWRITIKRQTTATTTGRATSLSNWLHDHVAVGDCLLLNGPHGDFVFEGGSLAPVVLLAAGVGITPLISMLKTSLLVTPDRRVDVFFQAQDEQHWPFGAVMHQWMQARANLHVHSWFSRMTGPPAVALGDARIGKYQLSDVLETVTESLTQFYLCGPENWMADLHQAMLDAGIAEGRIRRESFQSSAEAGSDLHSPEPWSIRFVRSGRESAISDRSTSVWKAAREHGIELPAACHSGACGTCKIKLLSGRVTYARPPACAHRSDEVVSCSAQALGPIEVDA